MGLFQSFRKTVKENQRAPFVIAACLDGRAVPMEEIPDAAFADGILGPCMGIDPPEDAGECAIAAPADGVVTQCSDTGHAVGITCGTTEILVHAGIDTVQMAGRGFTLAVQPGETVKAGQTLLVMDAAMVRNAGFAPVVVTVITETPGRITFSGEARFHTGDTLCTITVP